MPWAVISTSEAALTPSAERDFVAIIVAAGRSTRFGAPHAKQFSDLCGISVLDRSILALSGHAAVRGVVVVLPPEDALGQRGREIASRPEVLAVRPGGATRAESVRNGLDTSFDADLVLVHDAARPLVPADVISRVAEATREHGAAIPVLPVADTVKRVDDGGSVVETVDRHRLRLAQTPQGARSDWLRAALDDAARRGVAITDEASALEMSGHPVACVPGDRRNAKITTVEDLVRARRKLSGETMSLRIGTGFDIHRRGGDRPLVLGGVRFDGEEGLIGHSDADVVLHAAMDALLGAAALGDIGVLFPPQDPTFKDADSTALAAEVGRRLLAAGYEIVNLDLTLLSESPKIRPHHEAMRAAIARALDTEPSRIGLKATTLEKLGALGRGEGIACEAVALIRGKEGTR